MVASAPHARIVEAAGDGLQQWRMHTEKFASMQSQQRVGNRDSRYRLPLVEKLLPPATSIIGEWGGNLQLNRHLGGEYPARQHLAPAGTTGTTEVVGVVDLDEGGSCAVIDVDNAAVILIVFAVQQFVDLGDKGGELFCCCGLLRWGLANRIDIPADIGVVTQGLPEDIQLLPLEDIAEVALVGAKKGGGGRCHDRGLR